MMLRHGEYDQLVDLECNSEDYLTPADFFVDYQATKLLSKFPHLAVSHNRTENAMLKFIEAELSCRDTNGRFMNSATYQRIEPSGGVGEVLHRARRKIAEILGPVPKLQDLDFRFGPGAAYGVRGETSAYNKLNSVPECSFAMLPILGSFVQQFPGWLSADASQVHLVEGSELTFVPKNAKTDRPICIEPLLSGLYQKGFGTYMRKRLKRWGVNLDAQTVNQKLARRAWKAGLCTIDFSSASDTIAYGLVMDLLPIDWFEALDFARSPKYTIDGCWYNFEKFSSMGNAYTFELETLIFYALATAACEVMGVEYETGESLSVYGDDVIVPRGVFGLFLRASVFCGFSINTAKSFTAGCFYESCGEDYFQGLLVRPFFLKKDVDTTGVQFYVTNQVLRTIARVGTLAHSGFDHDRVRVDDIVGRLHDVHGWCVSCIPKKLRLLGPSRANEEVQRRGAISSGSTDVVLEADFDVAVPQRHRYWDGYHYRALVTRMSQSAYPETPTQGQLPNALYHAGLSLPKWASSARGSYSRLDGSVGTERVSVLSPLGEIPDPSDNGSGYTVRNRTKSVVSKTFWFGPWPQAPARWADRSISLCVRTREVPHAPSRRKGQRR